MLLLSPLTVIQLEENTRLMRIGGDYHNENRENESSRLVPGISSGAILRYVPIPILLPRVRLLRMDVVEP